MDDEDSSKNTKPFRKDIKRAKLFAIQHLTRRIKMLKNKRGTEQQLEKNMRKAARFDEELTYIKELDIDIIIKKIQNKDSSDSMMVATEEVEQRALDRLLSSKPIQEHLKQSNTTSSKISPSALNEPAVTTAKSKKGKTKLKLKQENLTVSSTSTSIPSSAKESSQSDNEMELERTPSSFFVQSLSSLKKREPHRIKQNNKPEKQNENNVNNKSRSNKKLQKERKKSSNRMGQRARQRLYKEQYGKKANHLKSNDKMGKPKQDKTRKKETKNTNKKSRQEMDRSEGIKRKEYSVEKGASHPSWEASKRRKLQQNISQTKFQGQKITFDDSD